MMNILNIALIFGVLTFNISLAYGKDAEDSCKKTPVYEQSESCSVQDEHSKPEFRRLFSPVTEPVPVFHPDDPELLQKLKEQVPLIIRGKPFLKSQESIDFNYLRHHLHNSTEILKMYLTQKREICSHGEKTNLAKYKSTKPHQEIGVTYSTLMEFYDDILKSQNNSRVLMSSKLTDSFLKDIKSSIDETWLNDLRPVMGEDIDYILIVAMKDYARCTHIDYSATLLNQVFGYKRIVFFDPTHSANLYPYPVHHAGDRMSMVYHDDIDYSRFPRMKNLQGQEAIVGPGDIVHLPSMWWHYIETEMTSPTFSVMARFLPPDVSKYAQYAPQIDIDASPQPDGSVNYGSNHNDGMDKPGTQIILHVKRYIEHLIAEATGSYRQVPHVLKEMLEGRFDDLEFEMDSL